MITKLNYITKRARVKMPFFLTAVVFNAALTAGTVFAGCETTSQVVKVPPAMELLSPQDVVLKGIIGQAVESSRQGRLKTLHTRDNSRLTAIFSKDSVAKSTGGTDWIGEHAGKWMYTAARAAKRTNDTELLAELHKVADYLVSMQEEDGYLGTYAPAVRMTSDSRENHRHSWDVWTHSYLILGFLEINRYWPNQRYVDTARKIGDLCIKTFGEGGRNLAYFGSSKGVSSTILLEPIVELYKTTGDKRYLDFGELILKQAEKRAGHQILSSSLKWEDLTEIGGGKVYQLCWNFMGIAKLYQVTGNPDYLKAARYAWQEIVKYHLTLGGGPWGGIGKHRELFNYRNYWSPYGIIETCSIMSWIHLNRELLRITGQAKYAEEIEKALYNALLGAKYPDGQHWCYFTFPNGKRHYARHWDCCPSSGALALEEVAPLVFGKIEDGLAVNIYTASEAMITLPKAGTVKITQKTNYHMDGEVKIIINHKDSAEFTIFLRIPNWAEQASVTVNGKAVTEDLTQGSYLKIARKWKDGDEIVMNFPMKLCVHKRVERQEHQNKDIYRVDWVALSRGPLVYAAGGLIDGKEREEMLNIPQTNPEALFSTCPVPAGFNGPAFQLNLPNRKPILFLPYYEAGGRANKVWRLTWLQANWQ